MFCRFASATKAHRFCLAGLVAARFCKKLEKLKCPDVSGDPEGTLPAVGRKPLNMQCRVKHVSQRSLHLAVPSCTNDTSIWMRNDAQLWLGSLQQHFALAQMSTHTLFHLANFSSRTISRSEPLWMGRGSKSSDGQLPVQETERCFLFVQVISSNVRVRKDPGLSYQHPISRAPHACPLLSLKC